MTLNTPAYNVRGNSVQVDSIQLVQDTMLNTPLTTTAPYFSAGTGAPTFTAPKGSVYSNITGSSASTRLYVNTDGATTWTNFTSAA